MRALLLTALLAGCGGGGGGDDDAGHAFDAGCDEPSDMPVIDCPTSLTVDCVPPEGMPLSLPVAAQTCDGTLLEVTCNPASGAVVLPGTSIVSCRAQTEAGAAADCVFDVQAMPAGVAMFACPDDLTAECTAPTSAIDVGEATSTSSCGATVEDITDDAPAAGFPLGETVVTFRGQSGGTTVSCTTTVTVTDVAAPTLTCPDDLTVARGALDEVVDPGTPEAADACDDAVVVEVGALPPERGTHTIEATATDHAGLTDACAWDVTILDAFAPDGFRLAHAERDGGGATVLTFAWEPSTGADTDGYAIEVAGSEDGPWTEVVTRGRGARLATVTMETERAFYRIVARAGELDGGASPALRAYAFDGDTYDIRGRSVPGIPFRTTLYGVVRHPADLTAGPYPLVLMLHGNHGNCRETPTSDVDLCRTTDDHDCPERGWVTTPNAEGMTYLAETLAAQGFIAATLSGNAMNCRTDFMPERAQLLLEHLRQWRTFNAAGGPPFGMRFAGAVDLARSALIGHSRGGEAVALVDSALRATPIPGVSVVSIFAIAPVDVHDPVVLDADYAVLLPSCDGDVVTLEGRHVYDRSIGPAVMRPRGQVLFSRANHNFFNTEWKLDDNGSGRSCPVAEEIGAVAQRGMLETVVGSWLEATVRDGGFEPFMRAEADTPVGIDAHAGADLDLRWSFSASERVVIDDFSTPRSPGENALGEENSITGWDTSFACFAGDCGGRFAHGKSVLRLSWDGGSPIAAFGLGALDTAGHTALSMRAVSRFSTFNSSTGAAQNFIVRVVDGAGEVAQMRLTSFSRLPHLYVNRNPIEILQTIRIPLAILPEDNPDFDPSTVSSLELEMTLASHPRGSIYVTDVELATDD